MVPAAAWDSTGTCTTPIGTCRLQLMSSPAPWDSWPQVVHGVDTACYGQGVSKTVDDLLEEASVHCAPCSGTLHAQADAATHCQKADLHL